MPKLGDAWVTISTKDAGFQKGISGAKKGFDSLVQTFARGNSFMVSQSNIGFRAVHRIYSLFKSLAGNTNDGKAAIEDMDKAMGAFGDSVAKAVTGGMDLAQLFQYITSIMQSLTMGTREWDMAGEGVLITLLQMQKYWGQFAGMTADETHKIQARLDELNEHMKKENDELTKRDVDNAQKKIDMAKKEGAAKRGEFLKMEDVWRDVQRRMMEAEAGGNKPFNRAQLERERNPKKWEQEKNKEIIKARVDPHVALEEERKRQKRGRSFNDLTPEEQRRWIEGAKHEEIDRLKQSGDPNERRKGLRMEDQEKKLKEVYQYNQPKIDPTDQESIDQERHRKIVADTNEYMKEAIEKQTEKQNELGEQEKQMMRDQTETLKKILDETKKKGGLGP